MSDENKILYQIADINFQTFSVCSEDDVVYMRIIYKDKVKLRDHLKSLIITGERNLSLKWSTKIELFCRLTDFLLDRCEGVTNIEVCTIFSMFKRTLNMSFRKNSINQIFDYFKFEVIRHSLHRPPNQIAILSKNTIEVLSLFFVDTIYKRQNFLKYMLTRKKEVDILDKDMVNMSLPHILDINIGSEIIPRNAKILKMYTENRKPKTELEEKIEIILEFERAKLEKLIEEKFTVQDEIINKKLEDLLAKKKK